MKIGYGFVSEHCACFATKKKWIFFCEDNSLYGNQVYNKK